MYVIFEDGSRQYRVGVNDTVRVDWREVEEGKRVEFAKVLLLADGQDVKIGQPVVEGVRVVGRVQKHASEKIYVQHFRRRKNYRRLKGHRQHYLDVKVEHILLPGQPVPPEPTPAPEPAPAPAPAPATTPTT